MNRKLRSLLLHVFLAAVACAGLASAQTVQTATASGDPLARLPASDVVGFIDVRRILTEVVPRLFAKDPATLAKMMSSLDELNKKTGINILSIDRIALGARFFGGSFSNLKKEDIGLALMLHGDFDANAFITALKRETKGKVSEATYNGKVIYSEPPPAPPKKRADRETPAVAVLDSNTVVVGDLPQVRASIDVAATGSGGVDSALVRLAGQDSSALMGVAGTVPGELKEALKNSAPKEESEKAIVNALLGIMQVYSSAGSTPEGFNIVLGARFTTAEQAQSVGDMLLGLRQQVGSTVPDRAMRNALEGVQITAQGDEVRLRADVKNEVAQDFITSVMKDEKPATSASAAAAPGKAKPTTKSRRARRRRRP
jgi:hypothetical protein